MSLEKILYEAALKWGFCEKTAREFYAPLGKYLQTGCASEEWLRECRRKNILDQRGRLYVGEEGLSDLDLILAGLLWEEFIDFHPPLRSRALPQKRKKR